MGAPFLMLASEMHTRFPAPVEDRNGVAERQILRRRLPGAMGPWSYTGGRAPARPGPDRQGDCYNAGVFIIHSTTLMPRPERPE